MYTQRAVAVVIRCDSATTTRKCLPSRPPPLSKHQRYQLAGEYRLVVFTGAVALFTWHEFVWAALMSGDRWRVEMRCAPAVAGINMWSLFGRVTLRPAGLYADLSRSCPRCHRRLKLLRVYGARPDSFQGTLESLPLCNISKKGSESSLCCCRSE